MCLSLAMMRKGMASGAQRDQVLVRVVASVATKLVVMNLQI